MSNLNKQEKPSLLVSIIGLGSVALIAFLLPILLGKLTLGTDINLHGFIRYFTYFSVGCVEVVISYIIFQIVISFKKG